MIVIVFQKGKSSSPSKDSSEGDLKCSTPPSIVVEDLTFKVEKGEVCAVIGPVGAGKVRYKQGYGIVNIDWRGLCCTNWIKCGAFV